MPNLTTVSQLEQLFNQLFESTENTILKAGAEEPFYQAPKDDKLAVIYSREDYLSSALHEIAHWCIAGEQRRQQDDFGYWYEPDGRSDTQQQAFEKVEVRPQALEWLFSIACGHTFHFSADNLNTDAECSYEFKQSVKRQAEDFLAQGLPRRAQLFLQELNHCFRNDQEVLVEHV